MINSALLYYQISGQKRFGFPGEREAFALLELSRLSNHDFFEKASSSPFYVNLVVSKKDLFEKLSLSQMMELLKKFPFLVDKLITSEILQHFSDEDLSYLSEFSLAAAKCIVTSPVLSAKLDGISLVNIAVRSLELANLMNLDTLSEYSLGVLGRKHLDIAKKIIKTPALRLNAGTNHFNYFCGDHEDIASDVLDSDEFKDNITSTTLLYIGSSFPTLAAKILSTPRYSAKVNGWSLGAIGGKNLEFAKEVVKRTDLHDRFTQASDIVRLACVNEDLALEIVQLASFRTKLTSDNLIALGKKFIKVARHVIANEPTLNNANIFAIVSEHPELLKEYLETPALRATLPGVVTLVAACGKSTLENARLLLTHYSTLNRTDTFLGVKTLLARSHKALALEMLANDEERASLSSSTLTAMATEFTEVARLILNTPTLIDKLDDKDLVHLACNNEDFAMELFTSVERLSKLTSSNLKKLLSDCHFKSVKKYISLVSLLSRLDSDDLADVAQTHPAVAVQILKTPGLIIKLDPVQCINLIVQHAETLDCLDEDGESFDELETLLESGGIDYTLTVNFPKQHSVYYLRRIVDWSSRCGLSSEQKEEFETEIFPLSDLIFKSLNSSVSLNPAVISDHNDDDDDDDDDIDIDDKPLSKRPKSKF